MRRKLTILLFLFSTFLIGQTNIDIGRLGINAIDESGNKQGLWQLFHNDSLVMSCIYRDNEILDTITYFEKSRIVMHYIPNPKKSLWFLYSSDTISGYASYDKEYRLVYYYADGVQIEEDLLSRISNVSHFKAVYYGGNSQMQKDLILNYDKSITSGLYQVSFVIDNNGFVTEVKVVESADRKMNKRISRMVENLGRWQPAHQRGKMVKMSMSIPIRL